MAALKAGKLGSMLNLYGIELTRKVQRVAVEETRLGIPMFFGYDVIHGHRTVFPIPLAEAAAFDVALWERTARIAALESAAEGLMLTFAPMLDVSRDPRWGRISESAGEDTWLNARVAEAKVRGFQRRPAGDQSPPPPSIGRLWRRDGRPRLRPGGISQRVPDSPAALQGGDRRRPTTLMPPLPISRCADDTTAILRDLVRGRWGFDGIYISDCTIAELVRGIAAIFRLPGPPQAGTST
jgi:beta-glucosidase